MSLNARGHPPKATDEGGEEERAGGVEMSDERIAASVKEKGLKAVVRPAAMYGLEMLKMELP